MNRKPDHPPFNTWQFFSGCIYHLGKTTMNKLYQVGERTIERWSADPATTATSKRNPLDRYEDLLSMLMERGKKDVARTAVGRQAAIVGCELNVVGLGVKPDKETVEEECLDDYPVVIEFHDSIRRKARPEEVVKLCKAAERELEETKVKYLQNWEG